MLSSRQDPPPKAKPVVLMTTGTGLVQIKFVGGPKDGQIIVINGHQAPLIADLLETVLKAVEVW